MKNRKVINAEESVYDNIKFKSKSEQTMYILLKESGLDFEYEPGPITLLEGFYPSSWVCGQKETSVKCRAITYTPDFYIRKNGMLFIVEIKGFITDRYPLKRKMLLHYLTYNADKNTVFLELHTKKDMMVAIDKIKSI